MVPYVPGTDWVDIEGPDGAVLKTVRAGSAAPSVTITAPSPNTTFSGDTLRVAWIASDPDGDPVYALVQYSADDGRTWRAVGFVTTDNFVDVPAFNVSHSSQGRFRVLISDGIHTSMAQVGPIVVPNRPPEVQLLSPTDGATFLSEQTIPFRAFIYDPDLGTLSGEKVAWYSDKEGLLGYGDVLSVAGLSVGSHLITLGTTPQQVPLSVDPAALPIGTHQAQITVTSPATDERITVDVVVRVATLTYLPAIFR
ncbi:MAG TPA: hypothetical protein EYH31_06835 [Anaerolineae bacterium]|nr:hypothetical protein [Anaerolineae bacterium]